MTRVYNVLIKAGFSEWCAREASDHLPNKYRQRKMVLDFILKHHRKPSGPFPAEHENRMHLFSLPGSTFSLESMMAEAYPGEVAISTCEFNGAFMQHPIVAKRIADKIPGDSKAITSLDTMPEAAPEHFWDMVSDGDVFTAKIGETSTMHVNCDAAELFARLWASKAPKLSALWYDGMGKMDGAPFLDFLDALPDVVECGAPIVITLLKGREGKGFLDAYADTECSSHRRVLALEDLFLDVGLRLSVKKTWDNPSNSSRSNRGCPMINFAGTVRRIRREA